MDQDLSLIHIYPEAGAVKPLVEKCLSDGKILGGICDASAFLGTIGALNHVRHTSNDLDDLKQWAGGAYTCLLYTSYTRSNSFGDI